MGLKPCAQGFARAEEHEQQITHDNGRQSERHVQHAVEQCTPAESMACNQDRRSKRKRERASDRDNRHAHTEQQRLAFLWREQEGNSHGILKP